MSGRRRAAPPADGRDGRQVCLLPPEAATFIHLVRENLRLLQALAARFEVGHLVPWADGATGGPEAPLAVRSPADVAHLLGAELATLQQEQLRVVLLDAQNRVLGTTLVYQGGLSTTVVASVADFFREAVRLGAHAIVLVHNHPSGDPSPSPEDVRTTEDVVRAGNLLGIEVVDHVVIGRGRHISLRERGLFPAHAPGREREPAPARSSAPAGPPPAVHAYPPLLAGAAASAPVMCDAPRQAGDPVQRGE